jgi:hypothetical protein
MTTDCHEIDRRILTLLSEEGWVDVETIARICGLVRPQAFFALISLKARGLVVGCPTRKHWRIVGCCERKSTKGKGAMTCPKT